MKNYVFSLKLSSTKIHVIPVIASCIEEAIHEVNKVQLIDNVLKIEIEIEEISWQKIKSNNLQIMLLPFMDLILLQLNLQNMF